MILKHLLEEINRVLARANEYDITNIESINYSGGVITFECEQNEVDKLKEDIKDNEDTINNLAKELKESSEENNSLLARIKTLEESLCDFKTDGETTAKDLLERAENAEKSEQNCRDALIRFKNSYSEMERKVDKLNARKNKATVERCRITGKLIAEFNGKKYFLEEFRGV